MNYRHIYHAGNFADVFKHWILTLILEKLVEKPTPFCVIDSHAGLGQYNLKDPNAQKTLEYMTGVQLFLKCEPELAFRSYLTIIKDYKANFDLYPGSPAIIQTFLRQQARLWCAELHPDDYSVLQQNFSTDPRIKVLHQDGYQAIKSLLPPPERRGLVFIDPPFEQINEISLLVTCLQEALKRFSHGIYAIWYPIKDKNLVQKMYREIVSLEAPNCLVVELHANSIVSNQLSSCGMVIINSPWQLEEKLRDNMPLLLQYLKLEQGSFKVQSLSK